MPQVIFRLMTGLFRIIDFFHSPENKLDNFEIKNGQTVIDYGCGPGRYITKAAEIVGVKGKVLAVDIHKLALRYVKRKIAMNGLRNVQTYLVENDKTRINDNTADVVYALDMFHDIREPQPFFKELYRLIKKNGKLYLEDGHQKRSSSLNKISKSDLWEIKRQTKTHLVLKPLK